MFYGMKTWMSDDESLAGKIAAKGAASGSLPSLTLMAITKRLPGETRRTLAGTRSRLLPSRSIWDRWIGTTGAYRYRAGGSFHVLPQLLQRLLEVVWDDEQALAFPAFGTPVTGGRGRAGGSASCGTVSAERSAGYSRRSSRLHRGETMNKFRQVGLSLLESDCSHPEVS